MIPAAVVRGAASWLVLVLALALLAPARAHGDELATVDGRASPPGLWLEDPNCIQPGIAVPADLDGPITLRAEVSIEGRTAAVKQVGGLQAPALVEAILANVSRCRWVTESAAPRQTPIILDVHQGELRLMYPGEPPRDPRRGVLLAALVAILTASALAWRWTLRRLSLVGAGSPGLTDRERRVRRSLRALLAFDFLVVWPLALPATILALAMSIRTRSEHGVAAGMVLVVLVFTGAVPVLLRMAKALERLRLAGRPDTIPPSFLIEGDPFPSRQASGAARWSRYLLLAALAGIALYVQWIRRSR